MGQNGLALMRQLRKTHPPYFFSGREELCPSNKIDSAVTNPTKCYAASVAFVKIELSKPFVLTSVP
jgi:hypothetical protein